MIQICRREQKEMLYPRIMMLRQIVQDLVRAERVAGKDDVLVTLFFRKGEIGVDILVCIAEALIPRTNELPLPVRTLMVSISPNASLVCA